MWDVPITRPRGLGGVSVRAQPLIPREGGQAALLGLALAVPWRPMTSSFLSPIYRHPVPAASAPGCVCVDAQISVYRWLVGPEPRKAHF